MLLAWMAAGLISSVQAGSPANYVVIHAGARSSVEDMLTDLARADVVFVGEEHDFALGHALELEILKGLAERRPKVALALEMFERDVQPVLDEYLDDYITEAQFLAASRPWPNYKTDYRPMVEFCRDHKLPVIAANVPRRYVNIVSRKGRLALLDLPKSSRAWLAPLPYSLELPAGYDKMLTDLFSESHGRTGGSAPPGMPTTENMKAAQALWDATMADSILRGTRSHRGFLIMQVNGAGHSDHGWGIVDRVRKANPRLKVAVVSIKPDSAYPNVNAGEYRDIADYEILGPTEKAAARK